MKLEKEIRFIPINGTLYIKFFLKGENGIVQFCINTGWNHNMTGFDQKIRSYAYDIGYHSPVPKYKDQEPMPSCDFYDTCYYDGSSMYADELFDKLIDHGHEYIWQKMQEFYNEKLLNNCD